MKSKYGDQMDFIHQEVYVDNDINKGLRRAAAGSSTCRPSRGCSSSTQTGKITARLEGSIGVQQFEDAVKSGL